MDNHAAQLLDLISIDPIYSALCRFLPTADRLRLAQVSVTFRDIVSRNPNTWKYLDFSGWSKDVIVYFIGNSVMPGAVEELVLDCTDVSEMTVAVILQRCPNLKYLGLGGATELMDGVLDAVATAKRNGLAPKLNQLGVLGAPLYKTTGVNCIAASIARDFRKLGVETDLVPCSQEHAFTAKPEDHWHLCTASPSQCHTCGELARGCFPCSNSRTCHGCFRFWCFNCESPISRVCYECGYTCKTCKVGIYVKCTECNSMFCKLHREDDTFPAISHKRDGGRTQAVDTKLVVDAAKNTCDWCIQGRNQGFGS